MNDLHVVRSGLLSEKDLALVEVGKKMITESMDSVKTFCQSMINTAIGGVALYATLIGIIYGDKFSPEAPVTIFFFLVPPFLFLVSALIFIFGYAPKVEFLDPSNPPSIEAAYKRILKKRRGMGVLGLAFLGIALITAIAVVSFGPKLGDPPKPSITDLKPGHVVTLKSGGAEMVVSSVDGDSVSTVWMSTTNVLQNAEFKTELIDTVAKSTDVNREANSMQKK